MNILSNAILHVDGKDCVSSFVVSPQISNCLVPWYITLASEQGRALPFREIRQLESISPSTSQYIRSLTVGLFTMSDWQGLLQSKFVDRAAPYLCSLIIYSSSTYFGRNNNNNNSANASSLSSVTGEDIANFICKFYSLRDCFIEFSLSSVNWREVASLFGGVFKTPSSNNTAGASNNTTGASNNTTSGASNNTAGASNNTTGGASNNTAGASNNTTVGASNNTTAGASNNTTGGASNNTTGAANNTTGAANNTTGASNNTTGASNNTGSTLLLSTDVTFSLVESLMIILENFNSSSPPPEDCKKIVLAFTDHQIVPKIQTVMEAMFYSRNPNLGDGKSLARFVQLLTSIFVVKNNALPSVATSTPEEQRKLRSFMSVEEMDQTFKLLHTLLVNRDLMRDGTGVLLSQVALLIETCFGCDMLTTANVRVVDPEKATFMRRYGRDMLPKLFEQITNFKKQEEHSTTTVGNMNPPFHMQDASPILLRCISTFINDAYWYDGDLETVEDVGRMIDVGGRKVLAHFPFEKIVNLLNEEHLDHERASGFSFCIFAVACYLKANPLLINAKKNDCAEFVEKYNLPVKTAERLLLELDTNATDEVGYSKMGIVAELWACIAATLYETPGSPSPFIERNRISLFGSAAENFPGLQQYVLPLIEKTFAFVDHAVEVMSARIINDGFSVGLESEVEKSLRFIKRLARAMTRTGLRFFRKIREILNELRGDYDEKNLTEAEYSVVEKMDTVYTKLASFSSDCENSKKNLERQLDQAKKQQGTRESGVRREREDD